MMTKMEFFIMNLGLVLAIISGAQSLCPNVGFSGMRAGCNETAYEVIDKTDINILEDSDNSTYADVELNNETTTNISGADGARSNTNGGDYTTTKKPTTTKTDIVDPYDDKGRAEREMIFGLTVPIAFGVFLLILVIVLYKLRVCKAPNENQESRCFQFWGSNDYYLPNPNQRPIFPMSFV